jgi:hypothetical protein
MPETARLTRGQSRLAGLALALCVLANAWDWGSSGSIILMRPMGSTALAQPADKSQLRAKIKSAAEKLNGIASAAPDMIRAMFTGNTSSASLLALDEKSIAAEAELEGAVLAAQKSGALSDDETKELARLGDLAKMTRGPVKEDIETLKSVPDLPIVGRDAAVRLAPKSQQNEVINNAEAAKKAVGELVAAIRKLP